VHALPEGLWARVASGLTLSDEQRATATAALDQLQLNLQRAMAERRQIQEALAAAVQRAAARGGAASAPGDSGGGSNSGGGGDGGSDDGGAQAGDVGDDEALEEEELVLALEANMVGG
jgi:hypothetical protein